MTGRKRIGVILILLGLFIPAVCYPLSSLTRPATIMQVVLASKGAPFTPSLNDLEIVIRQGNWIDEGNYKGHFEGHIAIAYRYIIAGGITAAFLGLGTILLSARKNEGGAWG